MPPRDEIAEHQRAEVGGGRCVTPRPSTSFHHVKSVEGAISFFSAILNQIR